ncbi:MAG: ABC-2 family transporter protein [Verrucomicrobiae bacterium]|nr:ABC-2 family transporter protein [Verrucomicrobiae bacterium]
MFPTALSLKIFTLGLQNTFVYRWNFLMRLCMSFIPLLGLVYFWGAVYEGRGGVSINGYSYGEMIFYFLLVNLTQALTMPLDDEWQIANEIRDGQLSQHLLKPFNYMGYRILLFVSNRMVYTLIALGPTTLIFLYFHRYLSTPHEPMTWLYTALALVLTATLQFLISYIIALFAFWILEVSTLVFIYFSLEYLFAGHLFPLDIMPRWMYAIIQWTPFPYQLFFPIAVFRERLSPHEMLTGFLIQCLWIGVLFLCARGLWRRGLHKYTAVGG